ncbi:MAG: integrase arm-type DNA-binding domain-containing protein [Pseudomonadales bacterium]|nr:integrase arm-type DNA-binding domain-containing protein [Pseudomonadales bacterium]
MALTATEVKQAKAKDKDYKLSDSGGLHLLVKNTGAKYWRMAYRFNGKQKTLAIGVYPDLSLADARSLRDIARNQRALGLDPSEVKKNTKMEQRSASANSFQEIANEWYTKQEAHWAAATAKKRRALLDNDLLPYLGKQKVSELQTFELLKCLQRIENRGAIETAHNGRQALNQIFRYAKQTQRCRENPAVDLIGALRKKSVTHRAAITDPSAFGVLLVKIDQYEGSHIIRTMLALAPLLFQRPGELAAMEWSELDLDNKLWNIPKEKKKERNKREDDHLVPLSSQAVALLLDIKPLTGRGKYVFPNQKDHEKHASPESINKALRIMGYDTATEQSFHGFRASARTMLDERLGFRVDWIEHQSGRKVADPMGRAYNRTKHLEQRTGMAQSWADYLDELRQQALSGNVIPGRFQRTAS